ncbi:MAG: acetyl-CoA carboxylase carboxyltransferase subunit alpha [Lentisphaerae bacterium]|nr:acetyl-CoA carboxylase carboxyltransferase subunit alpha [Lentisphaerota bacterium]
MATYLLPFEKPILELEAKLQELRSFSEAQNLDVSHELAELERKISETKRQVFKNLTAWDKVQLARHPQRPYTLDYIKAMCTDFAELHGDRHFADDRAIIGGFAMLGPEAVMIIGTQKGRDVKSNVERNFGMVYPDGYRKALRLMRLAAKFKRPIMILIDTAGAYPGVGSEERQIAEAIAVNLREAFLLPVPIVVTVIGEGGSGGALGIGIGDRVLILEHAYYSVISPEGCAAILWRDRAFASQAAAALKLTPQDLLQAGLVDAIIPEPLGGAHTDPAGMAEELKGQLLQNLKELRQYTPTKLLEQRYRKFRAMGVVGTEEPVAAQA